MEKQSDELKAIVKEKYSQIAREKTPASCGCSSCCSGESEDLRFIADYSAVAGHERDADLGLGCGIPTQAVDIKPGDTVLDLGSGAGNDVFVARRIVGDTGRVIGVDMTEAMVARAEANKKKLGFTNVDFRLGDIEALPVESDTVDVVISNCVLNLVPDKRKAFSEIHRVLKSGGHFGISDIVLEGELPAALREAAEMYAGCVSGALQKEAYLSLIQQSGFKEIEVRSTKPIVLPDEELLQYVNADELASFRASGASILSITVQGKKERNER